MSRSKKEYRYDLGKVDYNGSGRRNCKAAITWSLEDGRFSMCAEIWNPRETDIYCGGQCVDEVARYFPHNKRAQRMVAIWKEWHLNDMVAGSPAQQAHLKSLGKWKHGRDGFESYFSWALAELAKAGLQPDPGYMHNGKPYSYGNAWLKRDIPADVLSEIQSWSA